jgi:hypothetical protein
MVWGGYVAAKTVLDIDYLAHSEFGGAMIESD